MIYDFVDTFKRIKVGGKIKIKTSCILHVGNNHLRVPNSFINYIKNNSNKFTVSTIQEINDDNAMVTVFEVGGVLEYFQVTPFSYRGTVKVLNC
jgi:hypothetical protein